MHFRARDQPLIVLDGAFELAHQRLLGVQLLLGDGILRPQHPPGRAACAAHFAGMRSTFLVGTAKPLGYYHVQPKKNGLE